MDALEGTRSPRTLPGRLLCSYIVSLSYLLAISPRFYTSGVRRIGYEWESYITMVGREGGLEGKDKGRKGKGEKGRQGKVKGGWSKEED
jgi:hypothetical protein